MKFRPVFFGSLVLGLLSLAQSQDSLTSVSYDIIVKVGQKDTASQALMQKAAALGGYFSSLSSYNITLKVPTPKADSLAEYCQALGHIIQKNYASRNHAVEISDMQATLSAKRKLLEDYFSLIKNSSMGSVLEIEKAVVALQREIEQLQGRLNRLMADIGLARVTVNFRMQDRTPPVADGQSPFEWLNDLNLSDLQGDFLP